MIWIFGILITLIQLYKWYALQQGYVKLLSDLLLASIMFFTSNLITIVLVCTIVFINIIIDGYIDTGNTGNTGNIENDDDLELLVWEDSCDNSNLNYN